MISGVCEVCGAPFTSPQARAVTCGPVCSRKRAKSVLGKHKHAACARCGKPFVGDVRSRYCSRRCANPRIKHEAPEELPDNLVRCAHCRMAIWTDAADVPAFCAYDAQINHNHGGVCTPRITSNTNWSMTIIPDPLPPPGAVGCWVCLRPGDVVRRGDMTWWCGRWHAVPDFCHGLARATAWEWVARRIDDH